MENISGQKKGELLALLSATLWSLFPVITVLSYVALPGLASLPWVTLFAALFLGFVITVRGKWNEIKNLALWKYSVYIAFFIGLLYYIFYFIGLEKTSAGNAAIIAEFEVFTSFLLFNVLRREKISFEYKVGSVAMIIGALILLGRNFSGINIGDLFIVVATFCAPMGNFFQQKAREIASSEVIMFLRSAISVPFLFLLAYVLHAQASFTDIQKALPFLLVSSIFIFGLQKIFWIEAIHWISITKAVALASTAPFLTLLFAWLFLHQIPTVWQISSLIPLIIGVFLLTDNLKLRSVN